MLMIFRVRPTDEVSDPALCPSQFSSEILTRDGKRHFNCTGQRTIDSFVGRSQWCGPNWVALRQVFGPPPACFAVGVLSPLASPQVPPPRATSAGAPSFEVCSAKAGPRHFVLHQHFSQGARHHLCRTHCHSHPETTGQLAFRVLGPRPISPTAGFSCRSLVPCSVTTTASDDEFTISTNTPGWDRGSHVHPLAGLAGMYRIFFPSSRMGVLSLRPCSLCSGVFPSPPMSHLFIKGTQQIPPASTVSLRQVGFWFPCGAPTQLSKFWPDRQRGPPHVP